VKQILKIAQEQQEAYSNLYRPFVTVAFAKSLDHCIALDSDGKKSSNLQLSGPESTVLTHALRSQHDAILIGSKTLRIDNPRLNNRLWEGKSPQPVVLDTHLSCLEWPSIRISQKPVWVCCSPDAYEINRQSVDEEKFRLIRCQTTRNGHYLDLMDVLYQLRCRNIQSVMVEGGARVLESFLKNPYLVQAVCITTAPVHLGPEGVRVNDGIYEMDIQSILQFGNDTVTLATVQKGNKGDT